MSETLYEQVATFIENQVRDGVYRPGERLPSLRRLSRQLRVSIATAQEAYALLEDRDLLEARPQSGHYVRSEPARPPQPPAISAPLPQPTEVRVSDLAMEVIQANDRPGIVNFGAVVPMVEFPAIAQLHRTMASIARRGGAKLSSYAAPPGLPELRLQIARRAVDAGCRLSPDDIVITTGCQEALTLSLRAVAERGDVVAIESPTFYATLQTIESLGMQALEIPTHPETGISLEALELALESWPVRAVLLTPSFSNPLGYRMPDPARQQLMEMLRRHDLPLIEDDIYGDITFEPPRPRAVKSWDRDGRVLLCSSFSKTLEPGLRVGWVAPGRYLEKLKHLKLVASMATASLPQMAVAEFLEHGSFDRHLRLANAAYRRRRDRVLTLIGRHFPAGTRATCPTGGFVLWVELPRQVDALLLYRQALEHGISIAPGPLFSAKRRYRNFIRLSYANAEGERAESALRTLGELACALAGEAGG